MRKFDNKYKSFLFLLLSALFLTLFAPQEKSFKYQFYKGKPWQYELLTAPYDFPIYKSQSLIDAERDSVRQAIKPYYAMDETVGANMVLNWRNDYDKLWKSTVSNAYDSYISDFLRQIYQKGLITDEFSTDMRAQGLLELNLIQTDRVVERQPITRFYRMKESYELFFENVPPYLDKSVLRDIDISKYLQMNIVEDPAMREQVIRDELQSLSVSTGLVQAGERIVDKGDIVNNYTFNVLNSLKRVHVERSGDSNTKFVRQLGTFVVIAMLLMSLWVYLLYFRRRILNSFKNTVFMVSLMVVITLITQLSLNFAWFNIYIIPFVIVPILIRTFFDSRTAFYAHTINVLIAALFVPYPLEFILLQLVAGIVSVTSLHSLTSRVQLIRTTFFIFSAYVLALIAYTFMTHGKMQSDQWVMLLYFGINLIFLMFAYLLVYLMEKAFGYVSNISLVELSDMNTPLLRQLSEVAPGTFQHSLQVSILATEAASKIGANVQLVRTGALYHDIGKMKNPAYFTENQGADNPHNKLSYEASARIIIRHVTDGIALAQKHKLPEAVIDFIRTHHGLGKTKYFYNLEQNENPDKVIDPAPFTYPGPNPFSKETGLLMMADAVEASSRSLSTHTEEGIKNLIDRIVDSIVADGYLEDTPLTFRDIRAVKLVFFDKIKTMYHARISYPELRKDEALDSTDTSATES